MITFLADVHVGNHKKNGGAVTKGVNVRCRHTLDVLRGAVDEAHGRGDTTIILGDLFDYTRMQPQIIAEVQELLAHSDVIVVGGNHDQVSGVAGDNAVGALTPVASVVDVPESILIENEVDVVLIPFRRGSVEEWLAGIVGSLTGRATGTRDKTYKVLCIHQGISDAETPPHLLGEDCISIEALQKIVMEFGFTHVFAGHWHHQRTWAVDPGPLHSGEAAVLVTQIGTLSPHSYSDTGGGHAYGTSARLGSDGGVTLSNVPGPRFLVATDMNTLGSSVSALLNDPNCVHLHVSVRCAVEDVEKAQSVLDLTPAIFSSEIVVDRAQSFLDTAATLDAVRSQGMFDQVLHDHITSLCDDTVDAHAVKAFVDSCLTEANE